MATNYVRASFQEIYDFNTKPGSATIVGVHTPISTRVHQYLHGFFEQFKKFRYAGCSMTVVPVSQLPVDPLQVSYEAGDPGVDPRDIVNPILHRGMHGESLGNTLETLFNLNLDKSIFDGVDVVDWNPVEDPTNASLVDQMYYSALSSPAWRKSHVQRGFRKAGLTPMYYSLGTNRQYAPYYEDLEISDELGISSGESPGQYTIRSGINNPQGSADTLDYPQEDDAASNSVALYGEPNVYYDANGVTGIPVTMFTGRLQRLGWLDTLQTAPMNLRDSPRGNSYWTALPKLYMYMMMLPPCYKQRLHFRVILNHYYEFRGFRSMHTPGAFISSTVQAYNGYDGNMVPMEGPNQPIVGADATMSLRAPSDTLTLVGVEGELVTDGVS